MPSIDISILQDVYTDQNSPANNFNGASYVLIDDIPGFLPRQGHLKFNIGAIPANKFIISATLKLTFNNFGTPTKNLLIVDNDVDWDQATVTWNTKPSIGTSVTDLGVVGNGLQSFDVTDYVKANYASGDDYGITLYTNVQEPATNQYLFDRHTDPTPADRPILTVEYSDEIPVVPTLLYPDGIIVDRTKDLTFRWSGPFHLETEITWNDGSDHVVSIPGNLFEYTLPGNSMNAGTVTWKARQRYNVAWSELSPISIFTSADKPATPNITTVAFTTNLPTINWTSVNQTGFRLKILEGGNEIVSVTKYVPDLSYALTQELDDNTNYTIELEIRDDTTLWSDADTQAILSNFTKPDAPTFILTDNGDYATVAITNGANTEYNEVVKLINGVYTPIKTATLNETLDVYELVSDELESLKVRAFRDSGGFVDSAAQTITVEVENSQIVTEDGNTKLNLKNTPSKNNSKKQDVSEQQFAGRVYPVAVVGENIKNKPSWSFETFDISEVDTFYSFVGKKCLFRDSRGFIGWFVITDITVQDTIISSILGIKNLIEVER